MQLIKPIAIAPDGSTFSRSSPATFYDSAGQMRTAPNDTPRYTYDPGALTALPYSLFESAAVNRTLWSEDISNAVWLRNDLGGITTDAAAAPDGTTTMDKFYQRASGGLIQQHRFYQRVTVANLQTKVVWSRFFKAAEVSYVNLFVRSSTNDWNGFSASFKLSAGGAVAIFSMGDGTAISAEIDLLPGGVYRCSVVGIPSAADAGTQADCVTRLAKNIGGDYGMLQLPGRTFTRATTAVDISSTGVAISVASGQARLSDRGIRIEPATTNQVRNARAEGASAPSTFPTNWTSTVSTPLAWSIVGSGTINGMPYVDIRLLGVAPGSAAQNIIFDSGITAAAADTWALSFYIALIGGTTTGLTSFGPVGSFTGGGTANGTANAIGLLTSTLTRYGDILTAPAGTTALSPRLRIVPQNGGNIDATFRIAMPSATKASFLTTPSLAPAGTPGASTCSADQFTTTAAAAPAAFAIFFTVDHLTGQAATYLASWYTDANNYVALFYTAAGALEIIFVVGGVTTYSQLGVTIVAGTEYVVTGNLNATALHWAATGGSVLTGVPGALPAVTTRAWGQGPAGTLQLNGVIRRWFEFSASLTDPTLLGIAAKSIDPATLSGIKLHFEALDDINYSGDGASGAYCWGAMLEDALTTAIAPAVTSYIKTTTTQGARSADVLPTLLMNTYEAPPAAYAGGTTYAFGAKASISTTANGFDIYTSLQDTNIGHTPGSSPTWWKKSGSTYGVWAIGTTYAKGAVVLNLTTHHAYESQVNTNLGNDPTTDDGTKWIDLGADNYTAAFDGILNSQVSNPDYIFIDFIIGVELIDTVAALNDAAGSIRVRQTDATEGTVFDTTTSLVSPSNITDLYAYFTTPIERASDVIVGGLYPYVGCRISITLADVGFTPAVGLILIGLSVDVGDSQYGAQLGIISYSTKNTDTFGNVTVIPRAFSRTGNFTVQTDSTAVDRLVNMLAGLRDTPCLYYGSDVYTSTAIYGYYKDWTMGLVQYNKSNLDIEIEGLV